MKLRFLDTMGMGRLMLGGVLADPLLSKDRNRDHKKLGI